MPSHSSGYFFRATTRFTASIMLDARMPYLSSNSSGEPDSAYPVKPTNSIAQGFTQLSQDLKTGKLSSAQQDYAALKQEFQTHTLRHDGHHHYQSEGSGTDPVSQLMGQLGQALQSGNLTSAQQAYSSLQQDLQLFAFGSGTASSAAVAPSSLSVIA